MAYLGSILAVPGFLGTLVTACSSDVVDPTAHATINLGEDLGVLNFIYAVLQLETDYYTRITSSYFPGMLAGEADQFNNFTGDTMSARGTLHDTLIPHGRITDTIRFRLGSAVDFADRGSVLTAGQAIEDAAARGFAAAVTLVHDTATVTWVTTQAAAAASRAQAIRAMAAAPSLVVSPQPPADVLAVLAPYFLTTFTVSNS